MTSQVFLRASLQGAKTLLVAPGITASNKKLLGARTSLLILKTKGITTSSILATSNKKLLVSVSFTSSPLQGIPCRVTGAVVRPSGRAVCSAVCSAVCAGLHHVAQYCYFQGSIHPLGLLKKEVKTNKRDGATINSKILPAFTCDGFGSSANGFWDCLDG